MGRVMSDVDFAYAGVAIEDEINSAEMSFSVPEAEITSFGDTWQNFLAGKPTATLAVEGSADLAASQGDVTIFGDLGGPAQTYDFEPDGATGYDGFGIITSYTIRGAINAPITYSLALRHNGGSAAADGLAPTRA